MTTHTTQTHRGPITRQVRVCGQATNPTREGFPRYHVEDPLGYDLRTVPSWELDPVPEPDPDA